MGLTDRARNSYRKHARAVLMAVREPDDAIEEAGAPFTDNILPGSAFTAMIDAILNEDTTND